MEDIDRLFTAIESSIELSTSKYKISLKKDCSYPFSLAELPTDFSIEIYTPKESKLKQLLLFIDATKVFEKGSVEDAVLSIPYRYGSPDDNVFVHIVSNHGFTIKTLDACNQHPWLRLYRISNSATDFRLHRNNHIPFAIDEDQEDFLAENAKQNHFYSQSQYKSLIEYLTYQGISIKKDLIVIPDVLKKIDIENRVTEILSHIDTAKKGPDRLMAIAEYLKIDIVRQKMQESVFGYFSVVDNAIFLNSCFDNDISFRDNFTFAHELGHCALHRDLFEKCKVSRTEDDNTSTLNNIDTTPDGKSWLEWQANQFASFALMPKDEIITTFYDCAQSLYKQNKCFENMRRIINMGHLWLDPHDPLSDNRVAAYSLLTEISNKSHISKEALKYRLIELQLIKTPDTTKRKDILACLSDTLFTF